MVKPVVPNQFLAMQHFGISKILTISSNVWFLQIQNFTAIHQNITMPRRLGMYPTLGITGLNSSIWPINRILTNSNGHEGALHIP